MSNKKIAILANDGFEQSELDAPKQALEDAGFSVHVVAPESGEIQGNKHREHGDKVKVDITLDEADATDYDALHIPGGLFSPDRLRTNSKALNFVGQFFDQEKPVGAICHGPQILISAQRVKGRTLTAVEAIRIDLRNAGAAVKDEEVVVDQGLVTSRTPDDLDAFCSKLIEEIREGRHPEQAEAEAHAVA